MNKFLTKIIGASLAIAMMIGVGAGVNNGKETKPVEAENISCAMTGDVAVTVKEASDSTGNASQAGKKMNKGKSGTITVPAAAGSTTLYYHAVAWNGEAQTISLSCTNATLSKSSQEITANSGVSGSGTTYVIGSFGNYAYSVDLTQTKAENMVLTLSAASNKRFVIFYAYYSTSGGDPVETCTVTFNSLNGDDPTQVIVNKNGTIGNKMPTDPTKDTDTINQIRYPFGGWYKSDDPDNVDYTSENKVTSSTIIDADTNVYAYWIATNYYIISFETNGGSAIDSVEVDEGKHIATPVSTREGYNLEGWYTSETFDANTKVDFTKDTFTKNTTLYAKWEEIAIQEPGHFVKVTNTADIVDGGKYLITYEKDDILRAFDGNNDSLDSTSNYVSAEHTGSTVIKKDNNTASAYFTITSADEDYKYIKSASGYYIGRNAASNGLSTSTKASGDYQNTISFDGSGNVVITGKGGCIIKYNNASGQYRFRYFTSNSTQQPVQLYRFVSAYEIINSSTTQTQLSYHYSGNATDGFAYSNISIRFGGTVSKDVWSELDTNEHNITGFGVIIADGDLADNKENMATAISGAVSSSVTTTFTQEVYAIDYFVPVANMASTIGEDENNYFWNLRWSIAEADMNQMYSAAAYVKVGNERIIMNMARESVVTMATKYAATGNYNGVVADSLQYIVENA